MHLIQDEETEEETLWISDKCTEKEANKLVEGSSMDLKIATTFGHVEVNVAVTHHFEKPSSDIMREPVATIVQKSLLRCVTVSTMSTGGTEEEDSLQGMLLSLMSCLGLEDKKEELRRLCERGSSPFESKNAIDQLVNDILRSLTHRIIQDARTPLRNARKPRSTLSVIWAFTLANPIFLLFPAAIFMRLSERVELDYFTSLQSICNKVKNLTDKGDRTKDILHLEAELKHLEANENREMREAEIEQYKSQSRFMKMVTLGDMPSLEASTKSKIKSKWNNKKVVLAEQMVIQLMGRIDGVLEDNGFRHKLEAVLSSAELNTLHIFKSVQVLRLAYSKQCFVGFVGPQNAGKSTLLNKLFNKRAETGAREHTAEPTKYKVAKNVFAVDFPGLDSLEDHRSRFAEFGEMNNLFIYVMPYNGSPSESLVAHVRSAYAMERQAGNAARTFFCLNKCGREDYKDESFDDNYRKEFVGKIKREFEKTEFEKDTSRTLQKLVTKVTDSVSQNDISDWVKEMKMEQKELKLYVLNNLKADDFMFTDQLSQDPSRGIKGPKEVKERIKSYLIDMQIHSKEEMTDLF